MCVHKLYTIESSKYDVEMKTSTRTIITITVSDKWIRVERDEGEGWGNCLYDNLCKVYFYIS